MTTAVRVLVSARARALMSLGMVLGLGAVGTLAAWSTSTTTTSGVFTTQNIDIRLDGNQGTPTPYQIVFTAPKSLLPNDTIAAVITVQNTGGVAFTYTAAALGTDALGGTLALSGRAGSVSVSNNTCTGGSALPAPAGALSTTQAFGGTRGPLAASTGVDTLCLQFQLPSSAPNSVQGLTGNVVLTFTATSV